jgi:hypothetical protein
MMLPICEADDEIEPGGLVEEIAKLITTRIQLVCDLEYLKPQRNNYPDVLRDLRRRITQVDRAIARSRKQS